MKTAIGVHLPTAMQRNTFCFVRVSLGAQTIRISEILLDYQRDKEESER